MRKGTLAVISGFSGVGKGTVVKELVKRYPYALSVSATTRDPRPGEADGISYHFITKEAFEERIREGDFFEWASYVDQYYGTPKSFVLEELEKGHDVILEIEAAGAMKVKAQLPEALLIYMLPPSMRELKRRLVGRGTETEEKIEKRLKKAKEEELEIAREYDFLIVNNDLETCISELHRIIQTRTGVCPGHSDLLARLEAEVLENGV
ncbi:MAG: guanylate kinase [Firmicutes bacterium]|nr:guanylate kinase [Bacillota bacterium]